MIAQIKLSYEQVDEYQQSNLSYLSTTFGNMTYPFCCTTLQNCSCINTHLYCFRSAELPQRKTKIQGCSELKAFPEEDIG